MERVTIEDIEPWFLSGEPVVRLRHRDFDMPVSDYNDWLQHLAVSCGVRITTLNLIDPPGLVMLTGIGDRLPALADPLIKVSKASCPWLYCIHAKCRVRVSDPGMVCPAHGG